MAEAMSATESMRSSGGKRRKSQAVKKPEMTVEEVFASVSSVQASGLNPPPARTVLTPRSAESCLKHGINPEILRIRDLESFYDPNVDPAIQRMRHEAYSQRRHEMMGLVRTERKKIMNAEMKAGMASSGGGDSAGLTPGAIIAAQAKANATFVENEEKRMLKMKKRQEKEIEQMLQFEMKMSGIAEEREKRAEKEQQKEEQRKREKVKRGKLVAEERRLKDLRRKAMEDAEEEMRQQQAKAAYLKEKAVQGEREEKEREYKKETRLREEERQAKKEEHRVMTQRILDEQQAAIKAKMEEMESAEELRQRRLAEDYEVEKAKVEAKRRAIEERISRNMKMAAKVEEKRKQDFFAKQEHHEQLREDHLGAQERDRELQARQHELMEQRRLMVLAQTRRDEERRMESLRQAFVDEEVNVMRVKEARERSHMLTKEKKELKIAMKLENVNRIKRIQEYRRLETLRQIHEGDKRIDSMLNRKAEIVETRKLNAQNVKIQKDNLIRVMEDAKANGNKASKLIKNFLNKSTSSEDGGGGGGSPSSKQTKKALLTNGGGMPGSGAPPEPLGPKPPGGRGLEAKFDQRDPRLEQAPYLSPYDEPADPTTTVTF